MNASSSTERSVGELVYRISRQDETIAALKADLREARVQATTAERMLLESKGQDYLDLLEDNARLRTELDRSLTTISELREREGREWRWYRRVDRLADMVDGVKARLRRSL